MGMNYEGHGTDWLFDARGDRIERDDAVLFSPGHDTALQVGYVRTIHANGSVELCAWSRNFDRWARDVVLHVAREQRTRFPVLLGPER